MIEVACVGSRATTDALLQRCSEIGYFLAKEDIIVRSGGAKGADSAFVLGASEFIGTSFAGGIRIYKPWSSYKPSFVPPSAIFVDPPYPLEFEAIAALAHKKWDQAPALNRRLLTRNVAILLHERPVDLVFVCPPDEGTFLSPGSRHATKVAALLKIPCQSITAHPSDYVKALKAVGAKLS